MIGRSLDAPTRARLRFAVTLLIPTLLAAGVYAGTLRNGLIYDDPWVLEGARALLDGGSWSSLARVLTTPRSVTYLVHALDAALWGSWVPGFHLTNLILHALTTALVALSAKAVLGCDRAALCCASVFAVHPVHVEAVASLANRKDILATLFVLVALILFLDPRRNLLRSLLIFGSLALGLLAKEVAAIGAVPMLLLADLMLPARAGLEDRTQAALQRWPPVLGIGLLGIAVFALRLPRFFSRGFIETSIGHDLHDYGGVLATSLASVPGAARLLFWPVRLSVDYPVPVARTLLAPSALAGLGMLVAWALGAFLLRRRSPEVAFAMAWVLLTYLPAANLIPLTKFFLADRYLYTASFGACLLLGAVVRRASAGSPALGRGASVVTCVLVLLLAGRTFRRSEDWRDSEALWSAALRSGFSTSRVHFGLGKALEEQGRLDEALLQYREASILAPGFDESHMNLGIILYKQRRLAEAEAELRQALQRNAQNVKAELVLAAVLVDRGEIEEAVDHLEQVLRSRPDDARAHVEMGRALARRGDWPAALRSLDRAAELDPRSSAAQALRAQVLGHLGKADQGDPHVSRGAALVGQERYAEAVEEYRRALETNPSAHETRFNLANALFRLHRFGEAVEEFDRLLVDAPDPEVMNGLAWILATVNDSRIRAPRRAVELAERACRETHEGRARFLATLALAYAGTGEPEKAREAAAKATRIVRAGQEPEAADLVRKVESVLRPGR